MLIYLLTTKMEVHPIRTKIVHQAVRSHTLRSKIILKAAELAFVFLVCHMPCMGFTLRGSALRAPGAAQAGGQGLKS